jgi:hypothetical protein
MEFFDWYDNAHWGNEDFKEGCHRAWNAAIKYTAKTNQEAKDEPVGLIESLKDAKPCCGQYETCWRACTPRGKFIGQRDAQRKPLTDEKIEALLVNWPEDGIAFFDFARAIEAAHGIKGEA